jgi:hypothetical protein
MQNFTKIRPLGAELFNAARRTDGHDEANCRFSQFCEKRLKTSQLMLYREIIAASSEIHTKQINTLCGQNVEFLNAKPGGTYSDHWALKA